MSFQKLCTDGLLKIRPLLQKQLPQSVQMLGIVDLRLKGRYLKETFHTEYYGIPGTDIMNVTWTPKGFSKDAAAASLIYIPPPSLAANTSGVVDAFKNLIDWDKPCDFESVPCHFLPHLMNLVREKGGDMTEATSMVLGYIPQEVASKPDTTKFEERAKGKFEVAPLTEEHAEKMNSYWKYKYPGSEAFVAETVKTFGCAQGIFKKGMTNSEGLVSWGTLLSIGTIGVMYTLDEVRGHGLAEWSYLERCKLAAVENGLNAISEVEQSNSASKGLFRKLKLIYSGDVFYVRYIPHKSISVK